SRACSAGSWWRMRHHGRPLLSGLRPTKCVGTPTGARHASVVRAHDDLPAGVGMEPPRWAWPCLACWRTLMAEESAMRTILIAHKDLDVATELAAEFRQSGFRVIECPGPLPPKERCIRCDKGYCPLTEGADLMVYDPQLTAVDPQGRLYNLALD